MTNGFDVVVVSDFLCQEAETFEARTLLFLASWMENAGRAREFPLHLACIGEPPPSVCSLAEKAKALITIHQPVRAEGSGAANKMRGLEITGSEDRVLLLDADVVVLSDISGLAKMDYCIAASPANTLQIPEPSWRKIYSALGMELPAERIAYMRGELAGLSELSAMCPFYNGGIVFLPWNCGIRTIWEEHIRKITTLFNEHDAVWQEVAYSDQPGLATSIEFCKRNGVPFMRLPDGYHANWLYLYWRRLQLKDIKLFHAFGLFRKMTAGMSALDVELRRYRTRLIQSLVHECKQDNLWGKSRRLLPAVQDAYTLGNALQRLYKREVAGMLQNKGKTRS